MSRDLMRQWLDNSDLRDRIRRAIINPLFRTGIRPGDNPMTEQKWLTSTDPQRMLTFLVGNDANFAEGIGGGRCILNDRKLRLFACACCRSVRGQLTDERSRRAIEVAEACADGKGTRGELANAWGDAHRVAAVNNYPPYTTFCGDVAGTDRQVATGIDWLIAECRRYRTEHLVRLSAIVRHVFGNPWRPVGSETCPRCVGHGGHIVPEGATYRSPANALSRADYHATASDEWRRTTPTSWQECADCLGKGTLPAKRIVANPCKYCGGKGVCQSCSGEGCSGNIGYLDDPKERCPGDGLCRACGGLPTVTFSSSILGLAQAVYDGAESFALADALEEAGYNKLAEHFRDRNDELAAIRQELQDQRQGKVAPSAANDRRQDWLEQTEREILSSQAPHYKGCAHLDYLLGKS